MMPEGPAGGAVLTLGDVVPARVDVAGPPGKVTRLKPMTARVTIVRKRANDRSKMLMVGISGVEVEARGGNGSG